METTEHITAEELFGRVKDILGTDGTTAGSVINRMVHDTLAMACHAGVKGTGQAFGNMFSQVDFLCRRCRMSPADRNAIQRMRRHSNHDTLLAREDMLYDMRALCLFISAVFGTAIPSDITPLIPRTDKPKEKSGRINARYIRCIVSLCENKVITAETDMEWADGPVTIDCNGTDFEYIADISDIGTQLNLLDCNVDGSRVKPRVIVVEPDFLTDISSIAACFKSHGHHYLEYTVGRMQPRVNNYATLLGNFAGGALDEIACNRTGYDFADIMRHNFREKATEYCSCNNFDAARFKNDAATQVGNIRKAAEMLSNEYDMGQVTTEPSFICEQLGIQGRIDLMTTDMRLLVEQKSGRNMSIERQQANVFGSMQTESHYVQLLLYYGVLRYNFKLSGDSTDIRLLYSKYPPERGLLAVAYYHKLFLEAIKTRNLIVANELRIAAEGFESVINGMTPETLNTTGDASPFYHQYIYPQIEAVTKPLHTTTPTEREYFCRMMTFVYREQRISKLGAREGVNRGAADLWNMPLSEKKDNGNIYTGLTLKKREKSEKSGGYDMITLAVPQMGDDFMPNFRRGDMVLMYSYAAERTPDVRENILYKGSIAEISSENIVIALTDGQRNENFMDDVARTGEDWNAMGGDGRRKRLVAVEHAVSDASVNAAIRGMHEFITSAGHRKALLLGQREPWKDAGACLTRSYNACYDDILLRARQAKDYFLLIGPPGTGKTSMALRYIVEEELAGDGTSILLMAYTNRAVDEICDMLENAGKDYLRLGNRYSCDPRFRHRLIENAVEGKPKLSAIKQEIACTRIITCTTSMLMARSYLFNIKRFSLAVIDEASQILEPGIIGLLAAHRPDATGCPSCCIERFILIGDYKQLPAVVQQDEMEDMGCCDTLKGTELRDCRNSLFERLINIERANGRTDFIGILNRHGRMHPDIADFPGRMFYGSERLAPVPLPHQKETALGYATDRADDDTDRLLKGHRMVFIPSPACKRQDISDKVNIAEAVIVADVLRRIHGYYGRKFDAAKTVGVIVPYRNQIATIRREIEKCGIEELEKISIDTVERYQGSQRDVIIYSLTVQNRYQLEFLTDNCFVENGQTIDRKLNVAMTRARRQLIITGNRSIIEKNGLFGRLVKYIEDKGGMADTRIWTAAD